ncbi:hypothetical protein M407DRAFT_213402 [Tulasnella calospora MUT 4182]|uniref:asparaginase n=1 Tax=Tulasnella calospora MUT 4182 TaxID=1051891 RepID=A0A0C3LRN7_9AGAM|nr:hypothetical protein M407DRAFT_213402 [Tulasnella calospora MUT 4182]
MPASLDESRVLVIYTGGTIGNEGFVPESFFLTDSMRKESRFHESHDDSLFSQATSVQRFRTRHSRSASVPSASTPTRLPSLPAQPLEPPLPTLLVRSSRPIAQPPEYIRTGKNLSWKINPDCWEAHLPSSITPKVRSDHGTTRERRIRIATEIELNYSNLYAIVILHGIDTMGYTSSALSFLLEDLGKTVIPLSQPRSDAVDNLLEALTIAGQFMIPECCLYVNYTLFRGSRVTKSSSDNLDAFSSPNSPRNQYGISHPPCLPNSQLNFLSGIYSPPVGINIVVNWNQVLRQRANRNSGPTKKCAQTWLRRPAPLCLTALTGPGPYLSAALRLFPRITAMTVRSFLAPHIQGVILESYGAGNAPGRKDLIDVLKEACDGGVVIVTILQCAKGTVSDSYETGRALLSAGVVAGGDMTALCALIKLAYLLSKPELSVAQVRGLIKTPIRGVMTMPASLTGAASPGLDSVSELLSQVLRISSTPSSELPPPSRPSSTAPRPLLSITSSLASTTATPQGAQRAKNATAPWTLTTSDAASTQSALLPFLAHLAAARGDVVELKDCVAADGRLFNALAKPTAEAMFSTTGVGGIEGVGAGGSTTMIIPGGGGSRQLLGRSDEDVALAQCGAERQRAISVLLQSGALAHQRDVMDHTPLYYAARQGHSNIVQLLMKAGALLSGSDVSMGYADLGLRRAKGMGDEEGLKVWEAVRPPKPPHHHHSADDGPKEDNGKTNES